VFRKHELIYALRLVVGRRLAMETTDGPNGRRQLSGLFTDRDVRIRTLCEGEDDIRIPDIGRSKCVLFDRVALDYSCVLSGILSQFGHHVLVVFDEDRLMAVFEKQLRRFSPHAPTTGNE
jgi:hypothetical protein